MVTIWETWDLAYIVSILKFVSFVHRQYAPLVTRQSYIFCPLAPKTTITLTRYHVMVQYLPIQRVGITSIFLFNMEEENLCIYPRFLREVEGI